MKTASMSLPSVMPVPYWIIRPRKNIKRGSKISEQNWKKPKNVTISNVPSILEEERDALQKELIAAFGLDGRVRKVSDPNEKARKTISKAIGRTFEHIKTNDPNLWGHLQNALSLGTFPSYNPHPRVNWTN